MQPTVFSTSSWTGLKSSRRTVDGVVEGLYKTKEHEKRKHKEVSTISFGYVIINLESETKIETIFQSTYGGNGLVVHVFFIPARGSY